MEGFDTVRALARRKHDEAYAAAGGKTSASDLLGGGPVEAASRMLIKNRRKGP